MSRKKGYPRKPPRRKGIGGTVVLWLIMLAVVGGAVAQFVGPYAGWFEPAVERVRYIVFGDEKPDVVKDIEDDDDDVAIAANDTKPPVADPNEDPAPTDTSPTPAAKTNPTQPQTTPKDTGGGPLANIAKDLTRPEPAPKPQPAPPEKVDYRKLFDQYMAEELAKLKKPKPGRVYTVPTTKYDIMIGKAPTYKGVLMVIGNDRVVMRRNDNGQSVTITPDMISPKMQAILFPRIVARRRAVARLDKIMGPKEPQTVAKTDPEKNTGGGPDTVTQTPPKDLLPKPPETDNGNGSKKNYGYLKEYDPTKAKTPRHLGGAVKEYGQWIEMQQRRVGGRIATELYAKQHGSQVVLYMVVHPTFAHQKHDLREVTTEMMWNMWSRKCRESGRVSSLQRAHLVLLDRNRRVIGGSKVKRASDIWVKR